MILTNWPFVAASILLIAFTPGPSMLLGVAVSAQSGFKNSLLAGAGLLSALSVYLILSLSGVGLVLLTLPWLILIMQWIGVAYLVSLGMLSLARFSRSKRNTNSTQELGVADRGPVALYRKGLLTGLSNPKAIFFFSSVFPLFMDATASPYLQGTLLAVTFVSCWSLAFVSYAVVGHVMKTSVIRSAKTNFAELFSGVAYLTAAIMLACVARKT